MDPQGNLSQQTEEWSRGPRRAAVLKDFVIGCLDPKICDAKYSHMDATQFGRDCSKGVAVLSTTQDECPKGVSKRALSHGRLETRVPRAILQNDPNTMCRHREKQPLHLGGERCCDREVTFITN